MIDDVDRTILAILQENARISNAEIARRIGLAASAVYERIKKLETRGVITGYEVKLDPKALDLPLLAFVFVRAAEHDVAWDTGQCLAGLAEVQEVHHVAGEDCYITKVRAKDTESLGRFLRCAFGPDAGVSSTKTVVVLGTVKESSGLPLGVEAPLARPSGVTNVRR